MLGRIHSDIFHQPRAILANVPLKIRLLPSRDSFVLTTPAPAQDAVQAQLRINILDARLYIHTLEVTHSLALAHEHMLTRTNARYPLRRTTMKHLSIPQGQTSILHDNIYLGQLPERIVLALVSDASMAGGYQLNPFNFEHFGLNYLALSVNGELVPGKPFQPDFAINKYIREYNSIFEGMGVQFSKSTVAIPRVDYPRGYTLYVFDLTPDQSCGACVSPQRNGNVRIEIKFAAATAATINVLVYAEFESLIEIDKQRNVIAAF
jgi:hypothetical protein